MAAAKVQLQFGQNLMTFSVKEERKNATGGFFQWTTWFHCSPTGCERSLVKPSGAERLATLC